MTSDVACVLLECSERSTACKEPRDLNLVIEQLCCLETQSSPARLLCGTSRPLMKQEDLDKLVLQYLQKRRRASPSSPFELRFQWRSPLPEKVGQQISSRCSFCHHES